MSAKCCGKVWDGWRHNSCSRRGVVSEDGKLWCKQHAPSSEKKRSDDRRKKYDEEAERRNRRYAANAARYEIATYARELMDGVEFSQLKDKIQEALRTIDAADKCLASAREFRTPLEESK